MPIVWGPQIIILFWRPKFQIYCGSIFDGDFFFEDVEVVPPKPTEAEKAAKAQDL